jgi:hypothetical protein
MFEPMGMLQVHEVEMNWPDLEAVALNADADSVKFDAAKRGRYSIGMLTARCQIVCMMECRVRLHGCWALFPSHLSLIVTAGDMTVFLAPEALVEGRRGRELIDTLRANNMLAMLVVDEAHNVYTQ